MFGPRCWHCKYLRNAVALQSGRSHFDRRLSSTEPTYTRHRRRPQRLVLCLIGTMCVGAAGALIWNLSRLGHNEAPLVLPGWPATSHT